MTYHDPVERVASWLKPRVTTVVVGIDGGGLDDLVGMAMSGDFVLSAQRVSELRALLLTIAEIRELEQLPPI